MEVKGCGFAGRLSRREIVKLCVLGAGIPLLAACSPAPAPTPTTAPKPAAEPTKPAAAPVAPTAAPAAPTAAPAAATQAPAAPKPAVEPTKPAAPTPAPTKPAATVKRGGTLVEASVWTYPTLDPHLSSMAGAMAGFEALYDGLVRFDLVDAKTWEHKVAPLLAESWEQPDLKTIIFKLKKGVTFHDGTAFDADVAAWNILRTRDHPKAYLKTQMAVIEAAEAVDKSTLRLKLKEPNVAFLRNLAYAGSNVPMASRAAMDKGEDNFGKNPVGTGPFKFKQWVTDDRLILDRNPSYHVMGVDGQPLPYVDQLVNRYIPDPSVSVVEMQAGTIHLLERIQTKDLAQLKTDPNIVVYEQPWAGEIWFFGGFNNTKPPFNDVRVRQACHYGIDRDGMAKALGFGFAEAYYYGEWARGSLGFDESIVKYPYNPAKVKELLTAAGYPNGISLELKVIAREPENTIGEFVQQMWTNVGIKTRLIAMERLAWIDAVKAMNFDTCFWRGGILYAVIDPDLLRLRNSCGSAGNWSSMCDKEIDDLMVQGASTADIKVRGEAYKKALTLLQERAYLYSGIAVPRACAWRKNLQGVKFDFSEVVVESASLT